MSAGSMLARSFCYDLFLADPKCRTQTQRKDGSYKKVYCSIAGGGRQ